MLGDFLLTLVIMVDLVVVFVDDFSFFNFFDIELFKGFICVYFVDFFKGFDLEFEVMVFFLFCCRFFLLRDLNLLNGLIFFFEVRFFYFLGLYRG